MEGLNKFKTTSGGIPIGTMEEKSKASPQKLLEGFKKMSKKTPE